jgi:hypothetical protein
MKFSPTIVGPVTRVDLPHRVEKTKAHMPVTTYPVKRCGPVTVGAASKWSTAGGFLLLVAAMQLPICTLHAGIEQDKAVRAIIGEAANQKDRGMLAVACALRNRGTLRGVYGLNARHVDQQPPHVWASARKAWQQSAHLVATPQDPTQGATHWENIRAFGTPSWARRMKHTTTIGDHAFYK